MTDNFPARLREHLAESRRAGVPFDRAWDRATADIEPQGGHREGFEWPLHWMRGIFRAAYLGLPLAGGEGAMMAIQDHIEGRASKPRVPVALDTREVHGCRFGGDKECGRTAEPGSRFCATHLEELHRIRDHYRLSLVADSPHAWKPKRALAA